tara:strand:- start:248 stop:922 length:675 start_codon:yes stop_codon:yes gene_type:complete
MTIDRYNQHQTRRQDGAGQATTPPLFVMFPRVTPDILVVWTNSTFSYLYGVVDIIRARRDRAEALLLAQLMAVCVFMIGLTLVVPLYPLVSLFSFALLLLPGLLQNNLLSWCRTVLVPLVLNVVRTVWIALGGEENGRGRVVAVQEVGTGSIVEVRQKGKRAEEGAGKTDGNRSNVELASFNTSPDRDYFESKALTGASSKSTSTRTVSTKPSPSPGLVKRGLS